MIPTFSMIYMFFAGAARSIGKKLLKQDKGVIKFDYFVRVSACRNHEKTQINSYIFPYKSRFLFVMIF